MKFGIVFDSTLIRQYAAVFLVNLNVLTTGMSMAWPSPVLVKLSNDTETPLPQPMTVEEGSWMVSLGFIGGAMFNVIGGVLLDAIGRKNCLLLATIPKICMAILFIFATQAWIIILGRTIMITADCFIYLIVPVYASEIADKNQRGALGSFLQAFSSVGSVITLSIGPFTSYRTFNIIFTSLIIVTALPCLWLPDSPFFLIKKGRIEKCIKVLKTIRKTDTVQQEIDDYKISSEKMHGSVDKISLLKNKTFLKALSLGILMSIGTQFDGFNAVSFYLQTIFESTHSHVRPEIASVIIGILQAVAGFCTILSTHRFGRRTILISSLVGMLFGMVGLGIFFKLSEPEGYQITGFMNYLPLLSIILVVFCHSIGPGSLLWLITPELFDSHSRALGVSTSFITTTASIFITTKYFPLMTSSIGPAGTYFFYATTTAIFLTLIALFLPETKDKTFSEIQHAIGYKNGKIENQ